MKNAYGKYGVIAAKCALLLALLLASAGTVEATASLQSYAGISWQDARLSVSPGMSLTYTGSSTVVSAYVEAAGTEQQQYDITAGWIGDKAEVGYTGTSSWASGVAETTTPTAIVPGYITATSNANSDLGGAVFVQSLPHQTGTFTVSGNGIVTLDVPYGLGVAIIAEHLTEYASAVAEAIGVLTNLGTGQRVRQSERISASVDGPDGQFDSARLGTLSMYLEFLDGQTGSFMTMAHSEGSVSSVPEPSTFLLLGGGVAGLVLLRRRGRGDRR